MKNKNSNIIAILLFICLFIFLGWRFSNIVIYIFIALMFSVLGAPLVRLLHKIKIKTWQLPQTAAAGITLFSMIAIIYALFSIFIPMLAHQIQLIVSMDTSMYVDNIGLYLNNIEEWLQKQGILNKGEQLIPIFVERLKSMLNSSYLFGDAFHIISSFFIALFSILFMTFFSLKDNKILFTMIKKIIPISYRKNFDSILSATKKQLRRYFLGVVIEIVIIGTLEGLACYLLGAPNALLIGFVGGILNVIPYIGTLIAMLLGAIFAIVGALPTLPSESAIAILTLKIGIAFIIPKLLDDFILQPIIYGKSIQAHPLEIFTVILIAGELGGVIAMIFAVPAYSLCRIVIKEFFGEYYSKNEENT